MKNGRILYWLATNPACGNEYVGTVDGILILFSSEAMARKLLKFNGFEKAELYSKTKSELISEFGPEALAILEEADGIAGYEEAAIRELPEYDM